MIDTEKSFIEYQAKHLLHQWKGINKNIKGEFFLKDKDSKIAVAANIADFDSGISNRDSNSLRVLDAFKYPQVKFYSDQILITEEKIALSGELDFHGIKINKKFEAEYSVNKDSIEIEGNFSIVLTDFDIKLPSLMLVKMDDIANISYKLIFQMM